MRYFVLTTWGHFQTQRLQVVGLHCIGLDLVKSDVISDSAEECYF